MRGKGDPTVSKGHVLTPADLFPMKGFCSLFYLLLSFKEIIRENFKLLAKFCLASPIKNI